MATRVRTVDFLPEIFRTESNRQFLDATLDILTAQPNLKRVQGYVGNKYGYGINPDDKYVVEPTEVRSDYQLDPAVVFLKPDTKTAQDFITYPGIIDAIAAAGGITNNNSRLFESQFYSWDPFIVLDKVVNYAQYYWIPRGPDAVTITGSVNVNDIIGETTYTSPNGVKFTNGLKVIFAAGTTPSSYVNNEYYVEGVGTSIVLLAVNNYLVPEEPGEEVYNPWDTTGYDVDNYDADLYVSVRPEYITISRNSMDYNAWTRANRWFHQDVINTTTQFLGYVSNAVGNNITRAQRPIIEFEGNLQLINMGIVGIPPVDLLDTVTTNILTQVVGQTSYTVDGVQLVANDRVIFAADNTVDSSSKPRRQNVYVVSFSSGGTIQLTADSTDIVNNTQAVILNGNSYAGTTWRYNDETISWVQCQQKTTLNQKPLYDIFNENGTSLSNTDTYNGSTFAGCPLFSYTPNNASAPDPILGFPITYSGVNNIGDISFTVNLNSDTFSYVDDNSSRTTSQVNIGYVHSNTSASAYNRRTGWVTATSNSVQYQTFEFTVTETFERFSSLEAIEAVVDTYPVGTYFYAIQTGQYYVSNQISEIAPITLINVTATFHKTFVLDVPVVNPLSTEWATVQVYVNDNILTSSDFTTVVANEKTTVTLDTAVDTGAKITILALSNVVSSSAYYTVPSNLQNNPFNTNITTVDVGDLRNQYRTIFANARQVSGQLFGYNNIHDLPNLNKYGTAIIQNSSSLVLPGLFLRKNDVDFFTALQYNAQQYQIYKDLLIDIAGTNDYSIQQTPQEVLDSIIYQITTIRSNSKTFFWTDMLPSGSAFRVNTYTVGIDTNTVVYNLSRVYDYSAANYYGVAVYLTRKINNINRQRQLIRGVDYTVSSTSATVTVHTSMQAGDTITVREYNQTYGSYCPSTPTSLGLYPASIPAVVTLNNNGTPTNYILGHDGSINKLYGPYVGGQLEDFRDIALLEFETRVYNNIKVSGSIPLQFAQVNPGQFRTTDYTLTEMLDMYRPQFYNWVGQNRIDYKTQQYTASNQFTYNYNQSSNKLESDCSNLKQGYWRGIYRYFYDCEDPSRSPWEMLGFTNKPTWWDTRYGAAPYTSNNTTLWNDLRDGRVWNNGAPYINQLYVRPRLLEVLPVNTLGTLVSPFVSVTGNYNKLTFNRSWVSGDGSPAEATYWHSSQYAFDIMRLLALTKPAKFFNLFADLDNYKYNSEFNQYLFNNRYHLDSTQLNVYGSGIAVNSYINWIVDYVNVRGVDGYTRVSTYLKNLDVRLAYRLAGFSSKDYLKFYIERATPNSRNTSLLVPDENYGLLLYNNVPSDLIRYSSVVVQRVKNGWAVYGNSTTTNYFTMLVPQPNGNTDVVSAAGATITVSNAFSSTTKLVPYGTVFYSQQALGEFLRSYGAYLTLQGVVFDNISNNVVYDWVRMVEEFLTWSQQSWEVGSTIALNPDAKEFVVNREGLVVQPLTIYDKNFVLNQNLLPIQQQNASVYRENTKFTVRIINDGDTVAYTNLHLSSIEHAVVFDNVTSFNDTIYNLTTGLRQNRLLLKGYKTAEWNGYVDANGFILSEDNIKEWMPNAKYAKGSIVSYKSKYWVANQLIEPASVFPQNLWQTIDYDRIKFGLLPNPSSQSVESLAYYNSNVANLELDADLLSFSLIGYRPRDYLAAADLTDITQVNIFKNIIREKGTYELANSFKFAEFSQGKIDYDIHENWALNMADFGAVLGSNFVEAQLDQHKLSGNPTIIGFAQSGSVTDAQQTVLLSELVNYERPPTTANFLPSYTYSYAVENGLPTAGYVNTEDAKFSVYQYSDLGIDATNTNKLYVNNIAWIANYNSSWNVFSGLSLNTQVVTVENNLNGTATFTFSGFHNLSKNDPFMVVSFDSAIDGFYTVNAVLNVFSVVVDQPISSAILKLNSNGVGIKLQSRRFTQASDIANEYLPFNGLNSRKVWVDYMPDNSWAVYECSPVFTETQWPASVNAGSAVAYSNSVGYLFGNTHTWTVYQSRTPDASPILLGVTPGFGKSIAIANSSVFIASNDYVYYYSVNSAGYLSQQQQLNVSSVNSVVCSNDGLWLYVSAGTEVKLYHYSSGSYVLANTIAQPSGALDFANSISCSTDGVKLVVGSKSETANAIQNAGGVRVYSRGLQRYLLSSPQTTFTVDTAPPNSQADVYVNGVLVNNYLLSGSTITFASPVAAGNIVTVTYGTLTLQQTLYSPNPDIGGNYGNSVSTNRYGADFIVGAPYEINTVDDNSNVEGCVYRYTNAGQRYGTVVAYEPAVATNDVVFINGYRVVFTTNSIDPNYIAQQINTQTPTNIIATVSDQTLIIATVDNTVETLYNIIDVVATTDVLERLNITLYSNTQSIYSYNLASTAQFGYTVLMNERDSIVVGAPSASRLAATTFDYTDDSVENDTIYDNGTTTFVDSFANTGLVYEYDYLPANNESISNPGKYAFGQYISSSITPTGSQPRFGSALAYRDGVIAVGSANYYGQNAGLVSTFSSTTYEQPWHIDKQPLTPVDINRVNNISLYSSITNETLGFLDYCDPFQGKLLGAISENLDYIGANDPAGYANDNLQWGAQHIGQTWFDTTNYRLLNYNQPDLVYNAKNWGRAFSGSTAAVYTWIESIVAPLDYSGIGVVDDFEKYVEAEVYNPSTNSVTTRYYFWVRDYELLPAGKTLSPTVVSAYLLNPLSSGIAFMAPLTTNVIALYNSGEYIQDYTSILHIGYGNSIQQDTMHTVWDLIKSKNNSSFLTGLPNVINPNPSGTYLKYLDSFCGYDIAGNTVPDTRLPLQLRSGINFRPRQTMFMNRTAALQNFVQYANTVLLKHPVCETVNLSFLNMRNDVNGSRVLNSVRAATTAALTAAYGNGMFGVGATLTGPGTLPTFDGISVAIGDRVLVKNQADSRYNGIYVVTQSATSWTLTRTYDFDGSGSGTVQNGDVVRVQQGIQNASTLWAIDTPGNISFGTSEIVFVLATVSDAVTISRPIYDTRDYWTAVDWWAEGYSSSTKPVLEVATYSDLLKVSENTIITGVNGLIITLDDGLIARVKSNSVGLSETYVYTSSTDSWTRIGLEQGTLQINSKLYNTPFGFDWTGFSNDADTYDRNAALETRWIIRWINEYLYSEELLAERNNSLMLMFDYIKSETIDQRNYGQWLMKTSFIDVSHKIRSLLQYKVYQRDNTEFLTGFINEVKPYHVYIKDFVYVYDGLDVYQGNLTDFDLPAQYSNTTGKFESPQLVYQPTFENNQYTRTDPIWTEQQYNQWFANYGLHYVDQSVAQPTTLLRTSMNAGQNTMDLVSVLGLELEGTVLVDSERIAYNGVDTTNNRLLNLTRGVNNTVPAAHAANASVSVYVNPIVVLDTGRGYTSAPTITVSIDTSAYPLPRTVATATAIVDAGRVVSVNTTNIGSGYVVEPTLTVQSSSISATFTGASINTTNNTIGMTGHPFLTGDPVVFTTADSSNRYNLVQRSYYYVAKLDNNTIALYNDIRAAQTVGTALEKVGSLDNERVKLSSTGSVVATLAVTARLASFMSTQPLRSMKVTMKFDRVSYNVLSGDDTAANRIELFYAPTDNMPGKRLPQLMVGVEYPNTTITGVNFTDTTTVLDANLDASTFATTDTLYTISGGDFPDGYAPEELVASVVTDSLQIRVISDDLPTDNNIGYITAVGTFSGTISSSLPVYTNQTFSNVTLTGGSGAGARANVRIVVMPDDTTVQGPGTSNQNVYISIAYPNTTQNYKNYTVGNTLTISGTQLGGTSPANDITVVVASVGGKTWTYTQTVNRFEYPVVYAGSSIENSFLPAEYYNQTWYQIAGGWNGISGWNMTNQGWDYANSRDCRLTISEHPAAIFLRINNQ